MIDIHFPPILASIKSLINNKNCIMIESTIASQDENYSKRQNFREEIRRKQIQVMFAQKREILRTLHTDINERLKDRLEDIYCQLLSRNQIDDSLVRMGNYTALEDCLRVTAERMGGKRQCDRLCLKIVQHVLNVVIPSAWKKEMVESQRRRYCLVIVANIMADRLAPHNELIPIISESLTTMYVSVSQWGKNPETIEIGWIVSNTLCQQIDISQNGDLEKPVEQLLTWAEQIILIQNLDMLKPLYQSLKAFFRYVSDFHGSHLYDNFKVEHFKVHRLILLQNTVEYNLSQDLGMTLIEIFDFLKKNFIYFSACDETFSEYLASKTMKAIKAGASEQVVASGLDLMNLLCHNKCENNRKIKQFLIRKYAQFLQSKLSFQGKPTKIEVIKILQKICQERDLLNIILDKTSVESTLAMLLQNCREREGEIIIEMIRLAEIVLSYSEGKRGKPMLRVIEERFSHSNQQIGYLARQVLKNFGDLLKSDYSPI